MRRAARKAAGTGDGPGPRIPLFLDLGRLSKAITGPDPEGLWAAVRTQAARGDGRSSSIRDALERRAVRRRLDLYLDGLDEVPFQRYEDLRDALAELAAGSPGTRIVVATRDVGYTEERSLPFREARLQALEEAEQEALLGKMVDSLWPGSEDGDWRAWLNVLRSAPDGVELAGNPLWLSFLALAYDPERAVPAERGTILDEALKCLLERKHSLDPHRGKRAHRDERRGPIDHPAEVRVVLGELALAMTVEEALDLALRSDGTRPGLEPLWRELEETGRMPACVAQRWSDPVDFRTDVAEFTGIFTPAGSVGGGRGPDPEDDEPDTPWRFLHRSVQEALAAEALERRTDTPEGLVEVLRIARDWGRGPVTDGDTDRAAGGYMAETLALLAARWTPARLERMSVKWGERDRRRGRLATDVLVRSFARRDPAVARRLLPQLEALRHATVRALWTALSPRAGRDEEARGRIIASVPRLTPTSSAEERARGARLLLWIARNRRSASDLWFVEEALVGLAGAEEGLTRSWRTTLWESVIAEGPDPSGLEVFSEEFEIERGGSARRWVEIELESHGKDGRWDEFLMGSPESEGGHDRERPRHLVRLTRPFNAFATPVTHGQFAVLDGSHKSDWKSSIDEHGLARCPVTNVSWYAAMAFARWIGFWRFGSLEGSLPTEAQWEYLCRKRADGTIEQGRFAYGDDEKATQLAKYAWYSGKPDTKRRVHPVASLAPTGAGFYDLHGNVWEWCLGDLRSYPSEASQQPETDPEDAAGPDRAVRGGAYWGVAWGCRSACRFRWLPANRFGSLGFRPVVPSPRLGIDR